MDIAVFAAVLFSAFFQAGWNFTAKKSSANKIALLVVGWVLFGVAFLPVALWQSSFDNYNHDWWIYILGSSFIHAFYACLLGWAYSVGEISVVYPVSRGLGIVGTTAASLAFGLHDISHFGMIGIGGVIAGTLMIGLREIPERQRRHAFLIAILVAITVSSYSIVDSMGAKKVPPFLYVIGMYLFAPIFASPFVLSKYRQEMINILKSHKLEAFWVAGAGALAYVIILWAFQRAPVSYVAALREVSVVIASLLGMIVLKESLYKRKIIGIVFILVGVICVKAA